MEEPAKLQEPRSLPRETWKNHILTYRPHSGQLQEKKHEGQRAGHRAGGTMLHLLGPGQKQRVGGSQDQQARMGHQSSGLQREEQGSRLGHPNSRGHYLLLKGRGPHSIMPRKFRSLPAILRSHTAETQGQLEKTQHSLSFPSLFFPPLSNPYLPSPSFPSSNSLLFLPSPSYSIPSYSFFIPFPLLLFPPFLLLTFPPFYLPFLSIPFHFLPFLSLPFPSHNVNNPSVPHSTQKSIISVLST